MKSGQPTGITPRSTSRHQRIRACRADDESMAAARPYDRARDLPRLIPVWAAALPVGSTVGHAQILEQLRRALRAERNRGKCGHWTYDLARHAALLRAYRAEVQDLHERTREPVPPTIVTPPLAE